MIIHKLFWASTFFVITLFSQTLRGQEISSEVQYAVDLYHAANAHAENMMLDSAIHYYSAAIPIFISNNYNREAVICYLNTASFFYLEGNNHDAEENVKIGLSIACNEIENNSSLCIRAYILLSNIYIKKGEFENATLTRDEVELLLYSENLSPLDFDYYQSRLHLISVELNTDLGVFEESIPVLNRVIQLNNGLQTDRESELYIEAFNLRGLQYAYLGDYENALNDFNFILDKVDVKTNSEKVVAGAIYNNTAYTLWGVGKFYYENNDHQTGYEYFVTAEKYYQAAIEMWTNVFGEHKEIGRMINNYGMIYDDWYIYNKDTTAYFRAHQIYEEAINLKKNILHPNDPYIARSHMNTGALYYEFQDYENALINLHQVLLLQIHNFNNSDVNSIPPIHSIIDEDKVLYTLKKKGDLYMDRYQSQSNALEDLYLAFDHYELALALSSSMKESFFSNDAVLRLTDNDYSTIVKIIQVARTIFETSEDAQIWERLLNIVDQIKTSILLETRHVKEIQNNAGISTELIEKSESLQEELKSLEEYLFTPSKSSDSIRIEYSKVSREFQELIYSIEQKYPEFTTSTFSLFSTESNEIKDKTLDDPSNLIIEFIEAKDSTYCFAITGDGIHLYSLSTNQLKNNIDEYLSIIKNPPFDQKEDAESSFSIISHSLYNELLAPAIDYFNLIDLTKIKILPDGYLYEVPFEAFLSIPSSEGQNFINFPYLVRDYDVSYAHSLSLLNDELSQPIKAEKMTVFAPSHDSAIENEYTPLIYSQQEAFYLKDNFEATIFENNSVTKELFKKHAEDSDIIHIATHGVVNEQTPHLSFLVFNDSDGQASELSFWEINQLNLSASMSVLSACETALGEYERGEGLLSISRAFTNAGSASVIVNLWQIDDESTFLINQAFYLALQEGYSKDGALRRAKLQYIQTGNEKSKQWSHPYYWAGIISMGNMSPLYPKNRVSTKFWILIPILLLMLSSIILLFRSRH